MLTGSTALRNIRAAAKSAVSGHCVNASPAKTTRPTRSPLSRSSSAVTSSFARSIRDGLTSRASMLFDASRATTRSMPVRFTSSVRSPHCGPAAASRRKKSPSPIDELRATPCAAPAPGSTWAKRAGGTKAASRRCRRQARTAAIAPATSASGAIQRSSGVRIRTCCPSRVVWIPVMLRRPLQARPAQHHAHQPEERGRQEEPRVPLVVPGASTRIVDLALLQAVEDRQKAALQGLLVRRRGESPAGHAGDLLEQVRVDVDLDRLVRGAAEQVGAGRVGNAAALADQDGEDLDAQILRDAGSLQGR